MGSIDSDPTPTTARSNATDLERDVWAVIDKIDDPHIPVSLVELGMIYDVTVGEGTVTIELTYPCLGCPAYDMIQSDIENRVGALEGVRSVEISVVWDPPWSKARLSAETREKIRAAGIDL